MNEEETKVALTLPVHLSDGESEAAMDLIGDDVVWWLAGEPEQSKTAGPEQCQLGEMLATIGKGMASGIRLTITGITSEGDRVAVEMNAPAWTGYSRTPTLKARPCRYQPRSRAPAGSPLSREFRCSFAKRSSAVRFVSPAHGQFLVPEVLPPWVGSSIFRRGGLAISAVRPHGSFGWHVVLVLHAAPISSGQDADTAVSGSSSGSDRLWRAQSWASPASSASAKQIFS